MVTSYQYATEGIEVIRISKRYYVAKKCFTPSSSDWNKKYASIAKVAFSYRRFSDGDENFHYRSLYKNINNSNDNRIDWLFANLVVMNYLELRRIPIKGNLLSCFPETILRSS